MTEQDSEVAPVPPEVYERAWALLGEISDEVGEEELGCGYLLKYEGWSAGCLEDWWALGETGQGPNRGDEGAEAEDQEDDAYCDYAEAQSERIIDDEWRPALCRRGYRCIAGGYLPGGLYGRTWALLEALGSTDRGQSTIASPREPRETE